MVKEIVFKKWFISLRFSVYEPIICINLGFTNIELSILFLTFQIAKRI
jgi:hypothetical protein